MSSGTEAPAAETGGNRSRRLSLAVSFLAAFACAAGLLTDVYRDNLLVASGWAGTDLVTLFLVSPALAILSVRSREPAGARELLRLGLLYYMVYNYAFYLFGAAFNALFLVYVVIVPIAATALIQGLLGLDVPTLARRFRRTEAPARAIGAMLLLVATGLTAVYVIQSVVFLATGQPPAIVQDTGHPTSVVFALDLTLVVPPSALAGIWIWRRRPWGYALAAITSVKGTVYMIALSAATLGAWSMGALSSVAQLAVWGTIGTAYALATHALLKRTRPRSA